MGDPMRRVFLLRYKIKPEHTAENERLVRAVFDEIHRVQPAGISYSTFLLDDGLTYVNMVATETSDGLAPLGQLPSYQRIQQGKYHRFDEPPQATELRELGTYRLFEGEHGASLRTRFAPPTQSAADLAGAITR